MNRIVDTLGPELLNLGAELVTPSHASRAISDNVLQYLVELRAAAKAADDAHGEMYKAENAVAYDDPDEDKSIRYEIEKKRRCRAAIAARQAYQVACDAFVDSIAELAGASS